MIIASCNLILNKNTDLYFKKVILQEELGEISGLQYIDSTTLCAIQDEKGKIFFLQISTGKIDSTIRFGKDGDYEGIAKFERDFYILKSNGSIYKYNGLDKTKQRHFKHNIGKEFEGLCTDKKGSRLLVACKYNAKNQKHIWVYALNLNTFEFKKKEAYKISRKDAGVSEHFRPSGISMYNNKIYLLSSFSGEILVLGYKGEVEKLIQLDKSIFRQPEGITFDSEGRLYISNEKSDKQPSILIFNNVESLVQ